MDFIYGDAQEFERHGDWYVMLPLRIESDIPTVCDGEPTFLMRATRPVWGWEEKTEFDGGLGYGPALRKGKRAWAVLESRVAMGAG